MPTQVLLVEDDAMVLKTLADLFRLRQFAVTTASSGAEGIARLAEQQFDLVVTDMRMETATAGYDVIRAAKVHSGRPLAVILSAYPIPSPEWKQSGADAMFVKASGVARMLDDIAGMLSQRRFNRAPPEASKPADDKKDKRTG